MLVRTSLCLIVLCMAVTVFGQNLPTKNAKKIKKLQKQLKQKCVKNNQEIAELKEQLNNTQEQLNVTQELLEQQTSIISQLNNKVNIAPVFYTGRLSGGLTTTSYGQVVVFATVIDQSGDAYDQSSGLFTAPVKGVYLASVTAVTYAGKEGYLWFLHNNKNIFTPAIANIDDNKYSSGSSTATVLMKTGDTLKVVSDHGSYYDRWSSLSIHLVHVV